MQKKYKLYLESLRLERWPRSLAIIPGFIAVWVLDPESLRGIDPLLLGIKVLTAFILTWFISTANYIINEISDAPFDAFHPAKKHRPLVNKRIRRRFLMLLWLVLVSLSLFLTSVIFNNPNFMLSLIALLVAGFVYNVPPIRVKDIPILDSTIESMNNPIRFLIGWHITTTQFPPVSLLVTWWAFGNFLMVGKRVAEKKFLTETESAGYRRSLKKYSLNMLIAFMAGSGIVFLATFIIFALDSKLPTFLFAIPFIMVYLIMFVKKSIQDRDGAEEPEKLLKNPYFALYTLFLAFIFILAYIFR